jgi:Zn finger protein HypA/HybF involved in hydrogenase expression
VLECRPCGQQFSPLGIDLKCPHCGGGQVTVISGKEIYLEAIDIETNGDARQKAV